MGKSGLVQSNEINTRVAQNEMNFYANTCHCLVILIWSMYLAASLVDYNTKKIDSSWQHDLNKKNNCVFLHVICSSLLIATYLMTRILNLAYHILWYIEYADCIDFVEPQKGISCMFLSVSILMAIDASKYKIILWVQSVFIIKMDDILPLIWIKVFFLFSGMCENQLSRHKCHNNDFKQKYGVEILIRNKTKFCIQISTYVNTAIVIRNSYLVYIINNA